MAELLLSIDGCFHSINGTFKITGAEIEITSLGYGEYPLDLKKTQLKKASEIVLPEEIAVKIGKDTLESCNIGIFIGDDNCKRICVFL